MSTDTEGSVASLFEASRQIDHWRTRAERLEGACWAAIHELRHFMPTTAGATLTKLEEAVAAPQGRADE